MVSVFHSRTEDSEAVTFKKGIAAAFQANFRGTFEETEIDTNSKHLSHYRFIQPASLLHVKRHNMHTTYIIVTLHRMS